jgi:hypothetical protein
VPTSGGAGTWRPSVPTQRVPGAPSSGLPGPVSGVPSSGLPGPVSGVPSSGAGGIPAQRTGGTNGHPPSSGARRGPTRAEDILDAAARGGTGNGAPASGGGTRWWSKGGGPARSSGKPAVQAPREPVTAGTSDAGLPIRRPMAQLPTDQAAPAPATQPVAVSHGEPDPDQVSNMLTRFYSGVHRAGNEDDNPTVPINEPRSTA